jgi:hypothetical protein
MNARVKKIVLFLLAAVLLFSSGQLEKSLNRDRAQLGLTISEPLQNAPPLLAFTTVALGGFRGLISNFLWIRSNDLQQDDKYFEASQLADWITDLEPHFSQVWVFQSWNMAYNISVKFKDFPDRWRWVERGIELLRDSGLRYNPNDVLIHFQLAQFFQHKMGANLDDANVYYKQQWAEEMTPFFGASGTNFENLISPQTAEQRTNALILREKYKIEAVFAQKVDTQYGPLDWRLPEAHAIYWYAQGLQKAKENPDKVKQDDLMQLRRGIYQSMQQAFFHGRIINDPFSKTYALAPNLDLSSKAYDAYEEEYADEANQGQKDGIQRAERNFLSSAVYFLYENNRVAEAAKWYKLLGDKYPDKTILDNKPNSFPKNLTLEDYVFNRVEEEVGDTSQERTTGVVEGLIARSYYEMAIGQDDRSAGYTLKAKLVYNHYQTKMGNSQPRAALPPFADLNRTVLNDLLDTQKPVVPYAARAAIRTQLGMPAETSTPHAATISTNQVAPAVLSDTNTPAPTNN